VRASVVLLLAGIACASDLGPERYRLAGSGTHWDVVGEDRVLEDLKPRYPGFFEIVLDPSRSDEPDLLALREDLEREPADRRNYDALNAVAIAYFEMNYRGEAARRGNDLRFLSAGFSAAKLVAVPWRAYGEVESPHLRDAILDFFADIATGEKLGTARTRGRITRIVASLEKKESDPARLERIRALVAELGPEP